MIRPRPPARPALFRWTATGARTHSRTMAALALLLLALVGAPLPALATGVTAVEAASGEVRLSFDGLVTGIRPLALSGPDRLVLDVDGAEETGTVRSRATDAAVRGVRAARFDATTTRVVLDLARPLVVTGARWAADGRGVALSLSPADAPGWRSAVARRAAVLRPPAVVRRLLAAPRYRVRVPVAPAHAVERRVKVAGPDDRPLVVIDAGHGGHDPGSISPYGGVREKDVTLAIARAVRDRLLATGRMRVALTREDDRYLVLRDRFAVARRLGAQLFISIHADSAANPEARGATIYTLSEVASDREAARLASRENRADVIGGLDLSGQASDVTSILIGLTQRETMNVSSRFAKVLHRESGTVPFKPGYHRFASLMVLKAPDVPSVLYETGYMSNEQDVAWLTSAAGRDAIATGIAGAVSAHFARQIAGR